MMGLARPARTEAVETMNPKALLALALAAAIGGPALSQDALRDTDSNPYGYGANSDENSGDPYRTNSDSASGRTDSSPYGGETPSSEGAGGGSTGGPGQTSSTPNADPYAESNATSPFDEDLAEMNRRDREYDRKADDGAYNPLRPPKQLNPYGFNLHDAGRSASGGARPKPAELNGEASGALGFDPNDIDSILVPKSRPGSDLRNSSTTPGGPVQ